MDSKPRYPNVAVEIPPAVKKQGNGLIVRPFEPSKRLLTVEAHGAYDSIFLAARMQEDDLQATTSP